MAAHRFPWHPALPAAGARPAASWATWCARAVGSSRSWAGRPGFLRVSVGHRGRGAGWPEIGGRDVLNLKGLTGVTCVKSTYLINLGGGGWLKIEGLTGVTKCNVYLTSFAAKMHCILT